MLVFDGPCGRLLVCVTAHVSGPLGLWAACSHFVSEYQCLQLASGYKPPCHQGLR